MKYIINVLIILLLLVIFNSKVFATKTYYVTERDYDSEIYNNATSEGSLSKIFSRYNIDNWKNDIVIIYFKCQGGLIDIDKSLPELSFIKEIHLLNYYSTTEQGLYFIDGHNNGLTLISNKINIGNLTFKNCNSDFGALNVNATYISKITKCSFYSNTTSIKNISIDQSTKFIVQKCNFYLNKNQKGILWDTHETRSSGHRTCDVFECNFESIAKVDGEVVMAENAFGIDLKPDEVKVALHANYFDYIEYGISSSSISCLAFECTKVDEFTDKNHFKNTRISFLGNLSSYNIVDNIFDNVTIEFNIARYSQFSFEIDSENPTNIFRNNIYFHTWHHTNYDDRWHFKISENSFNGKIFINDIGTIIEGCPVWCLKDYEEKPIIMTFRQNFFELNNCELFSSDILKIRYSVLLDQSNPIYTGDHAKIDFYLTDERGSLIEYLGTKDYEKGKINYEEVLENDNISSVNIDEKIALVPTVYDENSNYYGTSPAVFKVSIPGVEPPVLQTVPSILCSGDQNFILECQEYDNNHEIYWFKDFDGLVDPYDGNVTYHYNFLDVGSSINIDPSILIDGHFEYDFYCFVKNTVYNNWSAPVKVRFYFNEPSYIRYTTVNPIIFPVDQLIPSPYFPMEIIPNNNIPYTIDYKVNEIPQDTYIHNNIGDALIPVPSDNIKTPVINDLSVLDNNGCYAHDIVPYIIHITPPSGQQSTNIIFNDNVPTDFATDMKLKINWDPGQGQGRVAFMTDITGIVGFDKVNDRPVLQHGIFYDHNTVFTNNFIPDGSMNYPDGIKTVAGGKSSVWQCIYNSLEMVANNNEVIVTGLIPEHTYCVMVNEYHTDDSPNPPYIIYNNEYFNNIEITTTSELLPPTDQVWFVELSNHSIGKDYIELEIEYETNYEGKPYTVFYSDNPSATSISSLPVVDAPFEIGETYIDGNVTWTCGYIGYPHSMSNIYIGAINESYKLSPLTTYTFIACRFDVDDNSCSYNTNPPSTGTNITTATTRPSAPDEQAKGIGVDPSTESAVITWDAGNSNDPNNCVVLLREKNAGNPDLVEESILVGGIEAVSAIPNEDLRHLTGRIDQTPPATDFDTWYCVYEGISGGSVTVEGLSQATEYDVCILEYSGNVSNPSFNIMYAYYVNRKIFPTDLSPANQQAINLTMQANAPGQIVMDWDNVDASGYVVFMKKVNQSSEENIPIDGDETTPDFYGENCDLEELTNNSSITDASGDVWYCVYGGDHADGTSITVSNLNNFTQYQAIVLAYNQLNGKYRYRSEIDDSGPLFNKNTCTTQLILGRPTAAGIINMNSNTRYSMDISWAAGEGDAHLVYVKAGTDGQISLTDNVNYDIPDIGNTANFGDQNYRNGDWYCVYHGTGTSTSIHGLSVDADYRVQVCVYNSGNGGILYNDDIDVTDGGDRFPNPATLSTLPTYEQEQISNLSVIPNQYDAKIKWTKGSLDSCIVIVSAGQTNIYISDDTYYVPNSSYGEGEYVHATWGGYCIDKTTNYYTNVTNLEPDSWYTVMVTSYAWRNALEPDYLGHGGGDAQSFIMCFKTDPYPPSQAHSIYPLSRGLNEIKWKFTNGNGDGRLLFIREGYSPTDKVSLQNKQEYVANSTYGLGSPVQGTDGTHTWYCAPYQTEYYSRIIGLQPGTTYTLMVCEYKINENYYINRGTKIYNTNTAVDNPFFAITKHSAPSLQVKNMNFSEITSNSAKISWTPGNGDGRAIFIVDESILHGPSLSGSDWMNDLATSLIYGDEEAEINGFYCIFYGNTSINNVTVSNLSPGTPYTICGYEFNGWDKYMDKYFTRTYNNEVIETNPVTDYTLFIPPTSNSRNISFTSITTTNLDFNWTEGNGASRLIFLKQEDNIGPGYFSPQDNTTYIVNDSYDGWKCIVNGDYNNLQLNTLIPDTEYRICISDYNGISGMERYNRNFTVYRNPVSESTLPLPPSQATNIIASDFETDQMYLTWSNGGGVGRAVFMTDQDVDDIENLPALTLSKEYNPDTRYGEGDAVGNWFCVYNGTGNSVAVSGLTDYTTYKIKVLEYSNTKSKPSYNLEDATGNPANATTAHVIEPVTQASNILFENMKDDAFDVKWTRGNIYNPVAVFITESETVTGDVPNLPDNETYTPSAVFGDGDNDGTGELPGNWYCIFNGHGESVPVTGLSPNTNYRVMVCEYTGRISAEAYNTNPGSFGNPKNTKTRYSYPTEQANELRFTNVLANEMDISWTRGNGISCVAFVTSVDLAAEPVLEDHTPYYPSAAYKSSNASRTGDWQCIYNGQGNSMHITNLDPVTEYRFMVCEYNGHVGAEEYLTVTAPGNPANQRSAYPVPDEQAKHIVVTDITTTAEECKMEFHWTENGSGTRRAVFMAEMPASVPPLVSNTTYTASTVFNEGDKAGKWCCIANGDIPVNQFVTVTDLEPFTEYKIMVCEYNGVLDGEQVYNTSVDEDNPYTHFTDFEDNTYVVTVTNLGEYDFQQGHFSLDEILTRAKPDANNGNEVNVYFKAPGHVEVSSALEDINTSQGKLIFSKHDEAYYDQGLDGQHGYGFNLIPASSDATVEFDDLKFKDYQAGTNAFSINTPGDVKLSNCQFTQCTDPVAFSQVDVLNVNNCGFYETGNTAIERATSPTQPSTILLLNNHFEAANDQSVSGITLPAIDEDEIEISGNSFQGAETGAYLGLDFERDDCQSQVGAIIKYNNFTDAHLELNAPATDWEIVNNKIFGRSEFILNANCDNNINFIESNDLGYDETNIYNSFGDDPANGNVIQITSVAPVKIIGETVYGSIQVTNDGASPSNTLIRGTKIYSFTQDQPIIRNQSPVDEFPVVSQMNANLIENAIEIEFELSGVNTINGPFVFDVYISNANGDVLNPLYTYQLDESEYSGEKKLHFIYDKSLSFADGDRLVVLLSSLANGANGLGTGEAIYAQLVESDKPGPIEELSAVAVSHEQINLLWRNLSTVEETFIIERSPDGLENTFIQIAETPANNNVYSDIGLEPVTTYYYRVKARNSEGDSYYSNIVSATTEEIGSANPVTLVAKAISSSQISLSWVHHDENETGFVLERRLEYGEFEVIAGNIAPGTDTYTDENLEAATLYEYRIAANSNNGLSGWSNIASASTHGALTAWDMDECTGDLYDPNLGVPGVLYGAKHSAGYYMHGVSLDGEEAYIASDFIGRKSEFTVLFRFSASTPAQSNNAGLFASTSDITLNGGFEIAVNNNGTTEMLVFRYMDNGILQEMDLFEKDNEWHHITIRNAEKTFSVFDNGTLIATNTTTAPLMLERYILGANRAMNAFFNGTVDDFQMYSAGLPDAEIAQKSNEFVFTPKMCSYEDDCLPIVSIEDLEVEMMDEFFVSMSTEDIDFACQTISWQCEIDYDETKLLYLEASVGSLTPGSTVDVNSAEKGKLRLGIMASQPIQGHGKLINLKFKAKGSGETTLDISNFYFNNSKNTNLKNGKITINTSGACQPMVTVNDVTAGICEPFDVIVETEEILDKCRVISWQFDLEYDCSDLTFKSLDKFYSISPNASIQANEVSRNGDRAVLRIGLMTDRPPIREAGELVRLQFTSKGSKSSALSISDFYFNNTENPNIQNGTVTISGENSCLPLVWSPTGIQSTKGDIIEVPVNIEELSGGMNIINFEWDIMFDKRALKFEGFHTDNSFLNTQEQFVMANQIEDGHLKASCISPEPINGQGNILTLRFTQLNCVNSDIILANCIFGKFNNTNVQNGSVIAACSTLDKCIASYSFNDCNRTDAEDVINGNNMLLNGCSRDKGYVERGMYFDGVDDYAEVPANTDIDISRAVTWSFFVKPIGGGAVNRAILAKSGAWAIHLNDNYPALHIAGAAQQWYLANEWLNWDKWSHVAISFNNGTAKIYVNGTLTNVFTGLPEEIVESAGSPIVVGHDPDNPGTSVYKGHIDEYKIYEAELSDSEVEQLAIIGNSGSLCQPGQPGMPTGPISICRAETQSEYSVTEVDLATSYRWILTPTEAGSVSGNTATITVDWNPMYAGPVELAVVPLNKSQSGPQSESLQITTGTSDVGFTTITEPLVISDGIVTLTAGWPSGGTYSGPGVIPPNQFDPAVAGPGRHVISYTANGDCPNDEVSGIVPVRRNTLYAIANGNWNENTIWSETKGSTTPCNCHPDEGTIAIINGFTVSVVGNASALDLYIEVENSESKLDVTTGQLIVNGKLYMSNK